MPHLGLATLHIFNTGDLRSDLASWLNVRTEDWPQYHAALGGALVIVDAG